MVCWGGRKVFKFLDTDRVLTLFAYDLLGRKDKVCAAADPVKPCYHVMLSCYVFVLLLYVKDEMGGTQGL